jgi:hypothetical protein
MAFCPTHKNLLSISLDARRSIKYITRSIISQFFWKCLYLRPWASHSVSEHISSLLLRLLFLNLDPSVTNGLFAILSSEAKAGCKLFVA